MEHVTAAIRERIAGYFPGMPIRKLEPAFAGGLQNDLVLVNDELIIRFAKDAVWAEWLANEYNCIRLIRNRTNIPVPEMTILEKGVACYPFIHGEPLFRHRLMRMEQHRQAVILEQLGDYMRQLHDIPLDEVSNAGIRVSPASTDNPAAAYERLTKLYEQIQTELYPQLRPYTCACVDAAFKDLEQGAEWFDYTPSLIHGDLALEHVLMDDKYMSITGILDWGVAGIGNKAHDLGVLLDALGEALMSQLEPAYPGLPAVLDRARVGLTAAHWHLRGKETGELFWHLTHLMTAKDIRY